MDKIRGASALRGWYDTGVLLRPDADGSLTVTWELRNGENRPAHVANWNDEKGLYEVLDFTPEEQAAESPTVAHQRASQLYHAISDKGLLKQWIEAKDFGDLLDLPGWPANARADLLNVFESWGGCDVERPSGKSPRVCRLW